MCCCRQGMIQPVSQRISSTFLTFWYARTAPTSLSMMPVFQYSDRKHRGYHRAPVQTCASSGSRYGNPVRITSSYAKMTASAFLPGKKRRSLRGGFWQNTGLGLSLAREIPDITGITINESGEPGKGARFEMTVPKGAWQIAGKVAG